MASVTEDPLAMTYFHIKTENKIMDWHEITTQAQEFTDAFEKQLQDVRNEDADVKKYFWGRIDAIIAAMKEVILVTEKNDPLLMLTGKSFTFVYFSLMRTGLHVGCWMAVPKDMTLNPKLLCCFLHEARIQKRAAWGMFEIESLVDCENDFDLSM